MQSDNTTHHQLNITRFQLLRAFQNEEQVVTGIMSHRHTDRKGNWHDRSAWRMVCILTA